VSEHPKQSVFASFPLFLQVHLSPEDLDALTDGRALCDDAGEIGPAEVCAAAWFPFAFVLLYLDSMLLNFLWFVFNASPFLGVCLMLYSQFKVL
jgi:hypothetical protein